MRFRRPSCDTILGLLGVVLLSTAGLYASGVLTPLDPLPAPTHFDARRHYAGISTLQYAPERAPAGFLPLGSLRGGVVIREDRRTAEVVCAPPVWGSTIVIIQPDLFYQVTCTSAGWDMASRK